MGDLILAAYESRYSRRTTSGKYCYHIAVITCILLFGLLIWNERYAKSEQIEIVLTIISLGTLFFTMTCQLANRFCGKKSIREYSVEMEQMEIILYQLDIDTFDKLSLVINEVKERIKYEEREQRFRRIICYFGVIAFVGAIGCAQYLSVSSFSAFQIISMLNLFLILSALLLSVFYVYSRVYSLASQYRWLYNMLLNVMITKF